MNESETGACSPGGRAPHFRRGRVALQMRICIKHTTFNGLAEWFVPSTVYQVQAEEHEALLLLHQHLGPKWSPW